MNKRKLLKHLFMSLSAISLILAILTAVTYLNAPKSEQYSGPSCSVCQDIGTLQTVEDYTMTKRFARATTVVVTADALVGVTILLDHRQRNSIRKNKAI